MSCERTLAAVTFLSETFSKTQGRAFLVVYRPDVEKKYERAQMVFLPNGGEVIMGRADSNEISLDYKPISRTHAQVIHRGGEIIVEDLGSRNGTAVNGERISGPMAVAMGDEIVVGPVVVVVGIMPQARHIAAPATVAQLYNTLFVEIERARLFNGSVGLVVFSIQGEEEGIAQAVLQLAESLRRIDLLVEYTPNEFICVLSESGGSATIRAAQAMLAGLSPFAPQVVAHAGFAVFPQHGTEANKLLSAARAAMYRSRALHSGQLVGAVKEVADASGAVVVQEPTMNNIHSLAQRVAEGLNPVLLVGEEGVGKEVMAGSIHNYSARAGKPYVVLDCSTLPEDLLERKLFGCEREIFEGAEHHQKGCFEEAAEGTVFLDEVGEMSLALQKKVLCVLKKREVVRVGGSTPISVDFRVICATRRDPKGEIERGALNGKLYSSLSMSVLVIPPLCIRPKEIMPLAHHFAREAVYEVGQSTVFRPKAERYLQSYHWPGNVSELRNVVERAVALANGDKIGPEHVLESLIGFSSPHVASNGQIPDRSAEPSIDVVKLALDDCHHNRTQTAKSLGISRFALIRLMGKYNIEHSP